MARNPLGWMGTRPDRPATDDAAAVAAGYRRGRWMTFLGVTGGYGVYYLARLGLSVAKRRLIDAGVADAEALGRIGAVMLLTYAVGRFVNGVLADRAHIGRFMAVGLLLSAVLNLLFGLSDAVWAFTLLWGLNGWFQSMGCAPSVVSLNQWFPSRTRGTVYSLWSIAHSLGEGLTFAGTAVLVAAWGWRSAFLAPGLFCTLTALILFRVIRDRPRTYGLPDIAAVEGTSPAATGGTLGRAQLGVLRSPAVWVLGLAGALFYVTRYGLTSWLMLYLQDRKGYGEVEAGWTMSLLPIVGVAGTLLAGSISDLLFRSRRLPVLLLYGILLLGSLLALHLLPGSHPWLDRTLVGAAGFAVGGLLVFLGGLMAVDLCPREATGTAMGFIGLFSYLGASVQDWVSGLLIGATRSVEGGRVVHDFEAAFWFWFGAAALSLLLTAGLGLVRRLGPAAPSPAR